MFKTIVVATDGSDHARKAVEIASDLAEQYGSKLVLIHTLLHGRLPEELRRMAEVEHLVEPRGPEPTRSTFDVAAGSSLSMSWESVDTLGPVLHAVGREILEHEERFAREKGVKDVKAVIGSGDAAQETLECAAREHADLIVTGSRGLSDLKGLFVGSVSHKVNHLAECTCLSVR